MHDIRRREFISLLGGAAVWPLGARGQQTDRIRRIGVLSQFPESEARAKTTAFQERMQELGWIEGRTSATICVGVRATILLSVADTQRNCLRSRPT
jgi:hypothetical protein